jgi:hypothetical protein
MERIFFFIDFFTISYFRTNISFLINHHVRINFLIEYVIWITRGNVSSIVSSWLLTIFIWLNWPLVWGVGLVSIRKLPIAFNKFRNRNNTVLISFNLLIDVVGLDLREYLDNCLL